jgi:branched-chain amino acid transport system ATP-binding protein
MLKINNLIANYGPIEALHSINIEVGNDEIVALIGSNGAGKTTTLNAISGHVRVKGSIKFNDEELTNLEQHKIAQKGVLQVPEGRHVFPGLTVEQNLTLGSVAWGGMNAPIKEVQEDMERVFAIFPKLLERRKQSAWSMSGGEQQMLVLGRAIMGRPKILLLDEPSMGLAPIIIDELFGKIVEINKLGTPVLLVEQNAKRALSIANRGYVMERGNIVLEGNAKDLLDDVRVKEAYLGKLKRD